MCISNDLTGVFRESQSGVTFSVTVLPRSSKCAIVGIQDNCLKVKLTRPPVEGEANAECCRLFAKIFGIPKSQVSILRGEASRHKVLQAVGIAVPGALAHLSSFLSAD